jgi:hypothetical protein
MADYGIGIYRGGTTRKNRVAVVGTGATADLVVDAPRSHHGGSSSTGALASSAAPSASVGERGWLTKLVLVMLVLMVGIAVVKTMASPGTKHKGSPIGSDLALKQRESIGSDAGGGRPHANGAPHSPVKHKQLASEGGPADSSLEEADSTSQPGEAVTGGIWEDIKGALNVGDIFAGTPFLFPFFASCDKLTVIHLQAVPRRQFVPNPHSLRLATTSR